MREFQYVDTLEKDVRYVASVTDSLASFSLGSY